jgi:hypothetical protein
MRKLTPSAAGVPFWAHATRRAHALRGALSPSTGHFERQGQSRCQPKVVLALQRVRYPKAASIARELSAFWKSLPQLNDQSGLYQMAMECDKLIEQLSGNNFR